MSSSGSTERIVVLALLAVLAFCAPASAAPLDTGVLTIIGQQDWSHPDGWHSLNARWNNEAVHSEPIEGGSGFELTVEHPDSPYDHPETLYDLWGSLAGAGNDWRGRPLTEHVAEPIRGAGTAADPLVARRTLGAGPDAEVVEEISTVKGEASFVARWTVRNTGSEPLNFRASAIADFGDFSMGGPGDGRYTETSRALNLPGPLRRIGSDIPEGGFPAGIPPGTRWTGDRQGNGGLLEELADSPWDHAELGRADEVVERIGNDLPARDEYASGYLDASAVAEWDHYVRGQPGLAPGERASFAVRYRLFDPLLVRVTPPAEPDCRVDVNITTRYGRERPRVHAQLTVLQWTWYLEYRHHGPLVLTTDADGDAAVTFDRIDVDPRFPDGQWGNVAAWFDRDGDGDYTDQDELSRIVGTPFAPAGTCPWPWPQTPEARPAPARARPALRVVRATRHGRRLVVRGQITRKATGSVKVVWSTRRRARLSRTTRSVTPHRGVFKATLKLPKRAVRARRQRVTVSYGGSRAYLPARVSRGVR